MMGEVIPLRPSPPRPKSRAQRAAWVLWATWPRASAGYSFDRHRIAELIRVAKSRTNPGLAWISPLAAHVWHLAQTVEPRPERGEIRRAAARLVAGVMPITPSVAETIADGVRQYRWRSYALAIELGITPAEKIALGLRTVRDVTESEAVMRDRRNARRRVRDAERRRAAGAEPREVRATRRALVGALATAANISQATSYRWVKAAEKSGKLEMPRVTKCEIGRLCSVLINRGGRANSHDVTPSALRMRRKRERDKVAEGADKAAPVAAAVVPTETDPPTIASLAADALTLPTGNVSFDPDRRAIVVQFRPVQPVPADLDPAPAFGEVLRLDGWPVRSTAFDGETIEIGIGEAA